MPTRTQLPARAKLLAVVAAGLAAIVLLILLAIDRGGAAVQAISPPVTDEKVAREVVSEPQLSLRDSQEAAQAPAEPAEPESATQELGSQAEAEALGPRLTSAMEATLYGDVDPCAFLDAALGLSKLEIDTRAIPEASPSGEIRYSLLAAPRGMSAEFWIRRSGNPKHDSTVLAYMVKFDRPSDGYVLAGAARDGPEFHVTLVRDPEGNLSHFAVMTNFDLWRTRPEGRIPMGSSYALDVNKPFEVGGGMSAMTPTGPVPNSDLDPVRLVGCPWPRMDDLERLKEGMVAMHAKLQR